jgi:DNA polymerase III epsilon subunit-like protein
MRYVSIDLETTGLQPSWCQVLEIGAIIDDGSSPIDSLPYFHCYVVHPQIIGEPYGLFMNAEILRIISEPHAHPDKLFLMPEHVVTAFSGWLSQNGIDATSPIRCAGKNFGSFDRQFLEKLPDFTRFIRLAHRSIDPGSMYLTQDDERVPSTEECARRAGIEIVDQHQALADARLVVQLIRKKLEPLPDFNLDILTDVEPDTVHKRRDVPRC